MANDEFQRIWLSSRQRGWTSLAIVPSDGSVDAVKVAESLAITGRLHGEKPVTLLNARHVQLGNVQQVVDSLSALTGRGDLVVVPVDPFAENPTSMTVARATSAALLILRLGASDFASARNAIDVLGRDRIIGSVVLDKRGRTSSAGSSATLA